MRLSVLTTAALYAAQIITAQLQVSTDGSCGGETGLTCVASGFGQCCSMNGWCGTSQDHCQTGCQAAYGTCGSASSLPECPPPTSQSVSLTRTPLPPPGTTIYLTRTTAYTETVTRTPFATRTQTLTVTATVNSTRWVVVGSTRTDLKTLTQTLTIPQTRYDTSTRIVTSNAVQTVTSTETRSSTTLIPQTVTTTEFSRSFTIIPVTTTHFLESTRTSDITLTKLSDYHPNSYRHGRPH